MATTLSPENTARLQAAKDAAELQALRKKLAALEGAAAPRTASEQTLLDTNGASAALHPAPRKAAPKAAVTSPFGPGNFAVSEKDGVVTIQFKLGVNLGISGGGKTHLVSRGDTSFKSADGTRFTFTAYRKVPGFEYPGK